MRRIKEKIKKNCVYKIVFWNNFLITLLLKRQIISFLFLNSNLMQKCMKHCKIQNYIFRKMCYSFF